MVKHFQSPVESTRIRVLNERRFRKGDYILYWMQASQRAEYNQALEYAAYLANEQNIPLVVYFGLTENYPLANERHYAFMLEGLHYTSRSLQKRGVRMIVRRCSPEIGIIPLAEEAAAVVVDCGYTRIQRYWRKVAADMIASPLIEVECDVVIPVREVSQKEEYAAATIRPKIKRLLSRYLVPVNKINIKRDSLGLEFDSFEIDDVEEALSRLRIDRSVKRVRQYQGGTDDAKMRLETFLRSKLRDYDTMRNDPNSEATSGLSPHLHFGQISPLYIALKVLKQRKSPGREAFLEELIVRRELSMNFVSFNTNYDSFAALPSWCRQSLKKHQKDKREYIYSLEQLERGDTHDPYWNAAQKEMVCLGKMAGYMRMYWGKKILEWTETPEEAYRTAIYLNDKYSLDGRDPNGYAGVAWCFGKHDRPWQERPIFGNIRYMNAAGLTRKFDADEYVKRVEESCRKNNTLPDS
mgnify:CR=1 FL=1